MFVKQRAAWCKERDPALVEVIRSLGGFVELRRVLGVVGSLVLMVGVFTPIVSAPFVGSLNYFRNGHGDGTILLALGVISLAIVWRDYLRGLLVITGGLSLAILTFTFVNLQMHLSEMRSDMATQLAGNPFASLATGFAESVQLQWGWALLVAGAGAVIAAGLVRPSRVKCGHCAELIQTSARICKHCQREVLSTPLNVASARSTVQP
jgi:hypothetical protein